MSTSSLTKRLGAAALAALTAVSLTACAGGSTSDGGNGGGNAAGDENKIVFWSNHPGKSRDLEQELIDAFEKENPDLDVELVDGGANYEELAQKFNAALAGSDLPDVIVASDVTWFNFALNKQIAPLDDLFAGAGLKPEEYVDSLLADTKFEFGLDAEGTLVLADEVLTPDSSRFWDAEDYEPGRAQASFDKQFVRDWLTSDASGWDRASGAEPPELPADVVEKTRARYVEAYERLTGRPFEA